jgi:hypothetical protein
VLKPNLESLRERKLLKLLTCGAVQKIPDVSGICVVESARIFGLPVLPVTPVPPVLADRYYRCTAGLKVHSLEIPDVSGITD